MLQGGLEENVLTLLCWDEQNAPVLVMRLTPDLFSTKAFRQIAECAFDHLQRYGAPPKTHLRDLLEAQIRKGESGKLLGQTVDAVERLAAVIQPEFVLAELDRFIRTRQLTQAVEEASDALQRGDVEKAHEVLTRDAPSPTTDPGAWLHDPARILAFMQKRDEDYFTSGIDIFDDRGVRPARKQLWLFIASAKKGKSWHLLDVARLNMMRGHRVLHISLENSEELTAQRYVQALFALSNERDVAIRTAQFVKNAAGQCVGIEYDNRTAEAISSLPRSKITRRLKALKNKGGLLIKEFPSGTLTFAQYEAFLDMLAKVHGWRPDLVVLDYPDLMSVNADKLRTDLGVLFRSLRGSAVKRNYALVTATQGNRNSADARTVNEKMVSEDYSKIGTADTVITYSQTGDERQLGLARLLVCNARGAADKYIVLISQNYATGQFCLSSVFMNRYLESKIDEMAEREPPPKPQGEPEE